MNGKEKAVQQLVRKAGKAKMQCSKGKGPRDSAARRTVQGRESGQIWLEARWWSDRGKGGWQTNVSEAPQVASPGQNQD